MNLKKRVHGRDMTLLCRSIETGGAKEISRRCHGTCTSHWVECVVASNLIEECRCTVPLLLDDLSSASYFEEKLLSETLIKFLLVLFARSKWCRSSLYIVTAVNISHPEQMIRATTRVGTSLRGDRVEQHWTHDFDVISINSIDSNREREKVAQSKCQRCKDKKATQYCDLHKIYIDESLNQTEWECSWTHFQWSDASVIQMLSKSNWE